VRCQVRTSVPRPLYPPKNAIGTQWIGGWVGLRAGLDFSDLKYSCSRNPVPARCLVHVSAKLLYCVFIQVCNTAEAIPSVLPCASNRHTTFLLRCFKRCLSNNYIFARTRTKWHFTWRTAWVFCFPQEQISNYFSKLKISPKAENRRTNISVPAIIQVIVTIVMVN
jgi:hypothetical protein